MSPDIAPPSSIRRGDLLRLILTAGIGLAIDLFTKHLAATRLDGH